MKFIIAIVLLILQTACGNEAICQKSDLKFGGLCIQKGYDISESDINDVISATEKETSKHYPSVINIAQTFRSEKIRVEFVDGKLAMNCDHYERDVYSCEEYIAGVNYDAHYIYSIYNECLADTALAHELLHSIELFYLDIGFDRNENNDHNTPWLFMEYLDVNEEASFWDIIENRIWASLACSLDKCAKDYADSVLCKEIWPNRQ